MYTKCDACMLFLLTFRWFVLVKMTVKYGKHTIHGSCGYRTDKPFRKSMSGNEAVSHSTGSPDTCCSDRILRMLWVQNNQTRFWEILKSVQFLNWTSTYRTYNDRYVHVCIYPYFFLNRTYQIMTYKYQKHISHGITQLTFTQSCDYHEDAKVLALFQ